MNEPVPPIMIIEGDDVRIFRTLQAAQDDLEPPDVVVADHLLYDARGRLLRAETDGRQTFLSLAEDQPSTPDILEGKLRGYLRYHGDPAAGSPDSSLHEIVRAASNYANQPFTMRKFLLERVSRFLRR